LPALELALESRLSESGDLPTHFEMSWIPGGSVGFLINLFGFFEVTMVVVREREVNVSSWAEEVCSSCLSESGNSVPGL